MKSFFYLFINLLFIAEVAAQVSLDSSYTTIFLEEMEATALAEKDDLLLGKVYFMQAVNLKNEIGHSETVFELFSKSLHCFETIKDSLRLYQSKRNIANYYLEVNLKKEALAILEEAFAYYERQGDLLMTTHLARDLSHYYRAVKDQENELI